LKFLHTMECWKLDRSTPPPQYNTGGDESSHYPFMLHYGMPARLTITRLENVKSVKEAQAIDLMRRTDIRLLALEWTTDARRFVDDEEVLRELEPPYSVSGLRLEGYNSVSFPSWVMRIGACLPDVTSIELSNLPSCKNLPPLGQLPNLEWLMIRQMDNIKKIDADLYGGTRAFPRLEWFLIDGMKCLEEWNTAYSSDEDSLNEPVFPRLRHVEISHCPRLRFKPRPPPSVHDLGVTSSDEVMLSGGNAVVMGASTDTRLYVEYCVVPLASVELASPLPFSSTFDDYQLQRPHMQLTGFPSRSYLRAHSSCGRLRNHRDTA